MNRAIAIMGSFIEESLKFTREKLEVDSWPAARAYLGDKKISGASPDTSVTPPPRQDDYIVWPVNDQSSQVAVWLDLQAVAETTGIDVAEVHRRWTLRQQS